MIEEKVKDFTGFSEYISVNDLIYKNSKNEIKVGGKVITDDANGRVVIKIDGHSKRVSEFIEEIEKLLKEYLI